MGDRSGDNRVTQIIEEGRPNEPLEELELLRVMENRLFGETRRPVTLDRYVVLNRVGSGGAGVVYRGYDPELDRKVAIKLLHVRVQGEAHEREAQARLLREAQAMARVSHPNVIAVHDVGTYGETESRALRGKEDEGREAPRRGVFVVMELVRGKSLEEWLSAETRSWREVLEVFVAAGTGLAAAHAQGVIHRDFKPSNVLLGDDGRVRVLDFGLARARAAAESGTAVGLNERAASSASHHTLPRGEIESELRDDQPKNALLESPLTQQGTVMGTPAYMAPEQHLGESADERADQFAFCAAVYQGLYGQLPFGGNSIRELETAKLAEELRPPPGTVPSGRVPPGVHRAVVKGLQHDPEARHRTMADLLSALQRHGRARQRRIRAAVVLGVAALGIGTAFAVGQSQAGASCDALASNQLQGVWDDDVRQKVRDSLLGTDMPFAGKVWTSVEAELDRYGEAWTRARVGACSDSRAGIQEDLSRAGRRMLCLDRRLARFGELTAVLTAVDPTIAEHAMDAVESLPPVSTCQGGPRGSSQSGGADGPNPDVEGRLLAIERDLARAEALRAGGRFEEAMEPATRALESARALENVASRGRAYLAIAAIDQDAERLSSAESHWHQALVAGEESGDDEVVIGALLGLGTALGRDTARLDDARRYVMHASARAAYVGLLSEFEGRVLLELGAIEKARGKYPEALEALGRALVLSREKYGDAHGETARAHNALGNALSDMGRSDEALEHYSATLRIREETFGKEHPKVADVLNNMAIVDGAAGRYEESLARHQAVLVIYQRAFGEKHPRTADSLSNIGTALFYLGRDAEALANYRQSLAILEAAYGPDHPKVGMAHNNFAVALYGVGRFEECEEHHRRGLQIRRRVLGPDHPDVGVSQFNLGSVILTQGRPKEAMEHLEDSLRIREQAFGFRHVSVAQSEGALGRAHMEVGEVDEGRAMLERSLSTYEDTRGPVHMDTAVALELVAWADRVGKRFQDALPLQTRALKIREQVMGKEDPSLVFPLVELGINYLELGQPEPAREVLDRAIALEPPNVDPVTRARRRFALARAIVNDERRRARQMAKDAAAVFREDGSSAEALAEVNAWLKAN